MQQPQQQPAVQAAADSGDPAEQYSKRRRTALWCTVVLLMLSIVVLVIGLLSATRTGNVAVAGYYPGIILSFGTFLGIVGLNVVENRRPMSRSRHCSYHPTKERERDARTMTKHNCNSC
ncbi:hypothetical protein AOLI_G00240430 [Acnodon oligacanthus]